MARDSLVGIRASEFPRGLGWLNSPELRLENLRDKIVLIDFWTYSCVNCIRTLPYVKKWHEIYASLGLVVVGVHTPEFAFERDPENVKRAAQGLGITYPVALDSDYKIWNLFQNHWWPRKLLVGRDGKIIYDHIGEGEYEATENAIREALGEEAIPVVRVANQTETSPKVCFPQTPELYLGYDRGYIGNPEGFKRDAIVDYKDDKAPYKPDVVYLHGLWKVTPEYLEHARDSEDDYIILNFKGTEANIVAEKVGGEGKLKVVLDDKILATLTISHPQMLNLVKRSNADQVLLKLVPQDAGIRLYAFTFGGCVE